jgi:MOSC domain-containing protein YiiM
MLIEQIWTSAGHNYFNHHGRPPGAFPLAAMHSIECVAGRGIRGDRFFDYRDNYKGQITFFSREVFDLMTQALGVTTKSPAVLRRNVIVSEVDLLDLIGVEFEVQGVSFQGKAHCTPCYWMNTAFAPGAEEFLAAQKGGGLRAQILTSGQISVGDARLRRLQSGAAHAT